jgi:hypothetical protein
MKKFILLSGVSAAFLTAGLQAYAQDPAFTNANASINFTIANGPYDGSFSDSTFKSGSTTFNNSLYTIASGTMNLTIDNMPANTPIELTIGSGTGSTTTVDGTGNETLAFALDSEQYNYIQTQDGTFNYIVTLDCELMSDQLIVNANTNTSHVPDGGATVMLLGGVLTALGLMKRKIA